MNGRNVVAARRNVIMLGATTAGVGLLFLYPTSTNNGATHRRLGAAAAAGIVTAPVPKGSASPAPAAQRVVVINGTSMDTVYGPVQVQIRVQAGKVLAATAIDYPQGTGRDQEINSVAIPLLNQEAVAAQSARIDTISGATYTSDGYQRSLQSALDTAHLH